jgi:hypothetical protein
MQKFARSTMMLTFAAALIGLLIDPAVRAQEAPAQSDISDEELKAFAKAYVQVDKIRVAFEPLLRKAQNPEQAQNVQREATGKMEKAVEEQGLTRESYTRIFNTVKGDAELRAKTIKMIQEEQKNP